MLIPVDEKLTEGFRKGALPKRSESEYILEKMISDIIRHPTTRRVILIDLDDPTFPDTGIKGRLNFIKQFVDFSLATGKITFIRPSQLLESSADIKKLIIAQPAIQKKKQLQYEYILREEALRYLYNLEQKIKKTEDKHLQFLWRILQSMDHLQKISREGYLQKNHNRNQPDTSSPHERYVDFMNVLSAFDIYVNNRIERSAHPFHHDSRSVR